MSLLWPKEPTAGNSSTSNRNNIRIILYLSKRILLINIAALTYFYDFLPVPDNHCQHDNAVNGPVLKHHCLMMLTLT